MNWLIKALGGFTSYEYDMQQVTLESWRQRCIAAETTVSLFKEIMTREQNRAEKLEERLVGAHPSNENREPPNIDPIGDRRLSSWPRIRRELEKQNRAPDAKISREEIEKTIRSEEQRSV